MKRSTKLTEELYTATLNVLAGKQNPRHLIAAVRGAGSVTRLALGDSFHQRMRKQIPYVEFFDEDIAGTKDRRPPVIPLEALRKVAPKNRKTSPV
jgi:hypothetical protein